MLSGTWWSVGEVVIKWEECGWWSGWWKKKGTKIVLIVFIFNKQTFHFISLRSTSTSSNTLKHETTNFASVLGRLGKVAERWEINSKLWVIKIIKLIYFISYKNDVRFESFPNAISGSFAYSIFGGWDDVETPWRGWIVFPFLSPFVVIHPPIHSAASHLCLWAAVIYLNLFTTQSH